LGKPQQARAAWTAKTIFQQMKENGEVRSGGTEGKSARKLKSVQRGILAGRIVIVVMRSATKKTFAATGILKKCSEGGLVWPRHFPNEYGFLESKVIDLWREKVREHFPTKRINSGHLL